MNQRVLRNVSATLTVRFKDQNGAGVIPTWPVEVSVTRGDGSVLVTGTADAATTDAELVQFTLTAAQNNQLDLLKATWTDSAGAVVISTVEVVGGYYFTIDEARDAERALQDVGRYPNEDLIRGRQEVETECETICLYRAFVPRYRRVVLDGSGSFRIELPNPGVTKIRSLSNNGVALTPDQIDFLRVDSYGLVSYLAGSFSGAEAFVPGAFYQIPGSVIVEYEYGDVSPPADLKRAAIAHLRHVLNKDKSTIPERAMTFSAADGGTYGLATAGRAGYETGIPEVDAVYLRYRNMVPAIA